MGRPTSASTRGGARRSPRPHPLPARRAGPPRGADARPPRTGFSMLSPSGVPLEGASRAARAVSLAAVALSLGGSAGRATAQAPTFAGNAQHTSQYGTPAQNLNAIHWQ